MALLFQIHWSEVHLLDAWAGADQFTLEFKPLESERSSNRGKFAAISGCTTTALPAFNPVEFDGIGRPAVAGSPG